MSAYCLSCMYVISIVCTLVSCTRVRHRVYDSHFFSVYCRHLFVCLFVYSSRVPQRLMWWVALRRHDALTAQLPAASYCHDIRDRPTPQPSTIVVPCSRAASEHSTSQHLWRGSAHLISRHPAFSCFFIGPVYCNC